MTDATGPGAVAVVGVGRQLPDAGSFTSIPRERFDEEAFASELDGDVLRAPRAALLHNVELDWRRLRLPPAQLAAMHRMERVALRATLDAIDDAALDGASPTAERTRVIFAAPTLGADPRTDHSRRVRHFQLASPLLDALAEAVPEHCDEFARRVDALLDSAPAIDADAFSACASIIAGRVASVCDFRGGHLAIDAALASSLAAIGVAVDALAAGACDCVVVCAVSPLVGPSALLAHAARGWLTSGRPRPFSPDADGTLLGEGAVAVVLVRDEHVGERQVHGWIEGVASCVADGTEPSQIAGATQCAAERALRAAGCEPSQIAAVESRAPGVRALDAAEEAGLRAVYGRVTPCRSAVEDVGFLQAAAGMVALLGALDAVASERSTHRIGVSDAGAAGLAYHAVVCSPARISALAARRRRHDEPLAITGAGLIAPGAMDVAEYWSNVLEGASFVGELPGGRWDVDALSGEGRKGAIALRSRLAAVLEAPPVGGDVAVGLAVTAGDAALADAGEAWKRWDPARVTVVLGQLSLRGSEADLGARALFAEYLQQLCEIMAEAGAPRDRLRACVSAARRRFERGRSVGWGDGLGAFSGARCASELARRHGFTGGAATVDAMCASSLAAVEIGAERLRVGAADAVLAGGVAWNLIPEYYIILSVLGALSSTGAPPFDPDRDGFVPAEGAGVVVLRRLSDARAGGERVHAVLRGIGAASDGRVGSVFAPTTRGQRLAVERALTAAHTQADEVDYVEAHGTGTQLGDVTELETYTEVFGGRTRALRLGTAKSQVGHLSSAAGIIGLIRTACAIEHGVLPPTVGSRLDPALPVDGLRLEVSRAPTDWPARASGGRVAGVSAFGLGGINYHVVLSSDLTDEPPAERRADSFAVELVPLALPERPARYPVAGQRLLLLGPCERRFADAIDSVLRARGAIVERADAISPSSGVHGIVDLRALCSRSSNRVSPGNVEARALHTFDALAGIYERLASEPGACYAAVTGLGGDCGLTGGDGDLFGAFLAGLARSLKLELPGAVVKAIDVDPHADAMPIAEAIVSEIEDGGDRVDLAYSDRRLVVNLRRLPVSRPVDDLPFKPGETVVFSGGGRGVVYVCARSLAERGVAVVVCGRTPLPGPNAPGLELDDDEFAAFRLQELQRRAREEGITPANFNREFERVARQRELHRNLQEAACRGLPLRYEVCDVTRLEAVNELVQEIRRAGGRITGIVHGAMVEHSARLPNKQRSVIEATIRTKVAGLINLLESTREDDLRAIVCFGSGAGRFGNAGQTDYSGANALMAATLLADARHDPRELQRLTIDWTAWESVGAAARDPDIAATVRRAGVTWVSVDEGTRWFLGELTRRRSGELVVFEERMLRRVPFLGTAAEGSGERAVAIDDRGMPLVPGEWPLVDRVLTAHDGTLELERTLDPACDAFLDQHRLRGVPILPATFGCELLAEAAVLLCPGFEVAALEGFVIDVPAKLNADKTLRVLVRAQLVHDAGDERQVRVESRSDLVVAGKPLPWGRLHHRATIRLVRVGLRGSRSAGIPVLNAGEHTGSFFEHERGPVELGRLFCRASAIRIGDGEVTGVIDPPGGRSILARSADPIFRVDPLLMDAALQVGANRDGYERGLTSIPLSIERVLTGRMRASTEQARVHARISDVSEREASYDLTVTGEDDEILLEIAGARLHRLGRDER